MFKQAWRSYLASLHPRNLKKVNWNNSSGFLAIYWLIIYPIIVGKNGSDEELHWGIYMLYLSVKMLPLLLMVWSNMVARISMPKMMYMTPMKEVERLAYVKALMFIKIAIPTIFSILLQLIWVHFFNFSVLQMLLIVFLHISIGIGTYVCSDLVNKHDRHIPMAVRDKNGEPKDAWLNTAVVFMSLITLVALEAADFMNGVTDLDGTSFGVIVIAILIIGLVIGDIVILKTRYKDTLDNLCNYEIAYRVLGKAKQ